MHKTSVILVTYYGATDTAACVRSLMQSRSPVRVIVVDCSPDDPELEGALAFAPEVVLLRADSNLGFVGGNNLGIDWILAHDNCEFIFVLNNDTIIYPDTVDVLEAAMVAQPGVGIMAPRIAYQSRPNILWYGGGDMDWRRAGAVAPGVNKDAEAPLARQERDVTFATGCALFMRRYVADRHRFNPYYFMYDEDTEFCLRVGESGVRIRYIPSSFILHRVQGSSRTNRTQEDEFWSVHNPKLPFYAYYVVRNRMLNIYLYAHGYNLAVALVFFPLLLVRRAVPFILGGRFDAVMAMLRGVRDFWNVRSRMIRDKGRQ